MISKAISGQQFGDRSLAYFMVAVSVMPLCKNLQPGPSVVLITAAVAVLTMTIFAFCRAVSGHETFSHGLESGAVYFFMLSMGSLLFFICLLSVIGPRPGLGDDVAGWIVCWCLGFALSAVILKGLSVYFKEPQHV